MKIQRIFIVVVSILMFLIASLYSQPIKVMTFNIRYANTQDGKNSWDNRSAEAIKLLNYYHPDFIGLQEVLKTQLNDLLSGMKDYKYIGVGREDGKEKGEYAPIFFDTSKYTMLDQNTFWLSDTPDKISKGWDAALERICTYGIFKDRITGKEIYVFNTHFDHIGVIARKSSAELILKKINELTKKNSVIFLMGDFNSTPGDDPVKTIKNKLGYGAEFSPKGVYGPKGTFNGFDETKIITEIIDYIFVKNSIVTNYRHIGDRIPNNNLISDHFPVMMEGAMK